MAQEFLKLTGNVHLRTVMPTKANGAVDWAAAGVVVADMRTHCKQGFIKGDSTDADFEQYLPISDAKNKTLLGILDAVNDDGDPGTFAAIVTDEEYTTGATAIDAVKEPLKAVS